jgi:hypothetical protein
MPEELDQFEDVECSLGVLAEQRLDGWPTLPVPISSAGGHGHDLILPDAPKSEASNHGHGWLRDR